jgi:membrane protein YqaA with SNARE-associated domain
LAGGLDAAFAPAFMTSETILLLWIAFVGTVVWPINPDAAFVMYVSRGHSAVLAVVVALVGQMAMLLLLFHAGHHLRLRWGWLDRQCRKVERRWGERLINNGLLVGLISGLVGIPPSVPTVLLASALGVPARRFLSVMFLARALWFVGLAQLGGWFAGP